MPKAKHSLIYRHCHWLKTGLLTGLISAQCVAPLHAELLRDKATAPAELRGIVHLSSEMQFSLRERESGQRFWLKLGQERHGIRLEDYDPDTRLLMVTYQGQNFEIGLEDNSNTPIPLGHTIVENRADPTPMERERNRPRISISPRRASVAATRQPVAEAGQAPPAVTDDDSMASILARGDKPVENNSYLLTGTTPAGPVAGLINALDYPVAPRNVSNLEILPKKNK